MLLNMPLIKPPAHHRNLLKYNTGLHEVHIVMRIPHVTLQSHFKMSLCSDANCKKSHVSGTQQEKNVMFAEREKKNFISSLDDRGISIRATEAWWE